MIYLDLLWGFLKIGCFSFGGAYGAIPVIRDVVLSYGWLSEERFAYLVAVSESTPGPIMINLATFIGSSQAGFLGSVIATVAVVLPSFFTIIILTALLKNAMKNHYVKAVLEGIRPSVIGIILATAFYMIIKNGFLSASAENGKNLIITVLLVLFMIGYQKICHKSLSPMALIFCSLVMGIVVYGV